MASFLQLYKTEIGDSLKQVINRKAQEAKIQKMARKARIQSLWINI